jgi:hypothetical protein
MHQTQAPLISVGFAELHVEDNLDEDKLEKLTIRADKALYDQKRSL